MEGQGGRGVRTARIAGAAALIAGLTVVARVAGFGRTVVFAWAVGDNDLGDIYLAANLIPNIVFEIVAGGALASLVVPLLAGAVAAGDRAAVVRTTSALLTWAVVLLVPLAGGLALAAGPVIEALARDAEPAQVTAGARMLRVFAPQLPLYGIGIVLAGVLQAHRRFAWPVLAPLLSSVTVAIAYLTFVAVDGRGTDVAGLSPPGLLVLAVGTTLGVVVLAGCLVPPVLRLGVRVRPLWRFAADARARLGGLAAAGAVTVAVQHLALLVVMWRGLAGPEGTWVLFTLAQTVFLVPWAVLAVPVATAAYPGLAEAAATGRAERYRATLASTTRAALLLSALGAAGLVALAVPIATLVGLVMPGAGLDSVDRLAAGIAGFAPGLVGYGLFAVLSRALYARGDTTAAALAAAAGWAAVAGSAVGLAAVLPDGQRVPALAVANAVGMTVLGAGLLAGVLRGAGRAALAGLPRTALVVVPAGGAAAVAGWAVAGWLAPAAHPPAAGPVVGSGMLAGVVVAGVFGTVAWVLDRRDVRPMVAAAARRWRRGGRPGTTTTTTTGDEDRVT
ncbi:MAG: virulence factor MviN [Micromonosporaceae bacterium]|nr:virulence factor MviN [Micromonosporaceae bacterium]